MPSEYDEKIQKCLHHGITLVLHTLPADQTSFPLKSMEKGVNEACEFFVTLLDETLLREAGVTLKEWLQEGDDGDEAT